MQDNTTLTYLNPNSDLDRIYELIQTQAKVIIFSQDDIFLDKEANALLSLETIPKAIWEKGTKCHVELSLNPIYVLECLNKDALPFLSTEPLKKYLQETDFELKFLLLRAKQLLFWHKNSLFCGACGHKTQYLATHSKICLGCSKNIFPTMASAVMVLISKGNKLLLARSSHFRPGVYSNLAGFIEAGETAEQTIAREVMEEVGLTVKNIRYFGTQAWPFENSFMIGYLAEYESGEIQTNLQELEDARWFSINALPELPFTSSIARRLIDHFLERLKK